MVNPTITINEYINLNKEQRKETFNELVNRILIVHPEYAQISKESNTLDLIEDIKGETKDLKLIKNKRRFF